MRLFEHTDFVAIVQATTEHLQENGLPRISPQIVEKDYYVTEMLCAVSRYLGDKAFFKGGTSLSKGWGLIQRFSEDVDVALARDRFDPPLGTKATKRQLSSLKDGVNEHPALSWDAGSKGETSNLSREDRFVYASHFQVLSGLQTSIRLEAGARSGDFPVERVNLSSYAADYLRSRDLPDIADDLDPFPMGLLHFRRTFLEKLYALHSKVELVQSGNAVGIGAYARHYYDAALLAAAPEVREMLAGREAEDIRTDYKRNCEKHFKHQILPPGMCLRESPAVFPTGDLRSSLERDYDEQCETLCFTESWPRFDDVLEQFEQLRELL